MNVKNDNSKRFNENFYDIIYKTSLLKIVDDYKETTAEEVKFIAKTMASLFLSKSNFNIYTFPNFYEELNLMENMLLPFQNSYHRPIKHKTVMNFRLGN